MTDARTTPPTAPPSDRRELDEAERRILDAAHRVFVRHGTAGARTQEIADEAGVNKSMLHYYFRTKERLAEAVFEEALDEWRSMALRELEGAESVERVVRDVVQAQVEMVAQRPYLPGYLLSELHHRPERLRETVMSSRQPDLGDLRRTLEAAAEAGEIRPITVEALVTNMVSLSIFPVAGSGLLEAFLGLDSGGLRDALPERAEHVVAFILGGLRPDPAA